MSSLKWMFEQYVRERQNKRIERALLEEHKKAAVRLFETNLDALRKAFACSPVSLQSTPLPSYPGAMWMGHIGINAFSVTQDIEVEQFPVYFNLVAAGRERVGQHQFVRDGSIHTFFCSAGFGNHDPGSGRYKGLRPRWDVLHPGRAWADKCQPREETQEHIARDVSNYFMTIAFPASHHVLGPDQQPDT